MDSSNWDVVVVGSGLGGLTAAAYLAALGRRVAVLEQHYVAGGNAHVFRRMKKFEFDVGVHYVGDCGPNGGVTQAFRGLGLDTKIEWVELDPDGFDTLIFPGLTFKVPASWDLYRERLVAAFPDDESAIHSCIDILQAVNQQQGKIKLPVDQADLPRLMQEAPAFLQWGMRTLGDLFEACGVGQKARAVIAAECGDYATPPSRTPVALHAGLLNGYFKGAYYPRGGGQVLPAHLVDVVRSNGGDVRTRARVERILVQDGRTCGVRLDTGEEFHAPVVISNADLKRTMLDMVGEEHISPATAARVRDYRMALPFFVVYLGLDIDLRETMPRTNYWYYDSFDLEGMYADATEGRVPEDFFCFISAGSVKDPETGAIAPKGCTSLEIMTIVPADHRLWSVEEGPVAGERYHRNPGYRSFKDQLADRLIEGAERVIPGLREHIVWREAATPITQERYTFASGGTSYGIELAVDQFGPARPSPKTEIEGLYLAGASTVFGHGIAGVIRGGVGTASLVAGRDLLAEVAAGAVFGDPSKLTAGGPGWDPWEASR
ncbi:MAG: NAD(P)/FAD-dependent oxidoreductase [Chloroflexi bacterium]|nr:NAD(P)/FAD-dependent oxidoreductase [Dehalococcoidia bacterium]MCO5201122.1 NAD(P)/FAD-dependent oxidoreductase [Chloroflexota bacterium]